MKTISNDEKANEIARYMLPYNNAEYHACYNSAIKAMKWKDEQMKEALKNILIECDACFDEQTTNTLESIIKHQIDIL